MAAITDGDLVGMIDTNNVGLVGVSQGGDTVFQMLGLLSDPVYRANWCDEHPDFTGIECTDEGMPLEITNAYRAQLGLQTLPDNTWTPFGDERIHAALAIDPCDFPLTNDDSLAAVMTPTMILHSTLDEVCDYEGNAVRTYSLLGTEDRYLISMVNGTHVSIFNQANLAQHYGTAFFGEYLQGDNSYDAYLTPESLPNWAASHLVWGPYGGE